MVAASVATTFSPDFSSARQRFRNAASHLGWQLESFPIGGSDPMAKRWLSMSHVRIMATQRRWSWFPLASMESKAFLAQPFKLPFSSNGTR